MVAIFSASGFFVHTPWGPRKSGMPESVEIPAPVSTTMRRAASIQARTVSMRSLGLCVAIVVTLPFLGQHHEAVGRALGRRERGEARVEGPQPSKERGG